ncbi:MAG: glycosyltransferase [Gallionella sp.]
MQGDSERPFGVVAIGRNEGMRLKNCLASVIHQARQVVYVDSGSTDGSVNLARDMGVAVVELDLSIPFTAARARNEGVARLRELVPDIRYIQFVDGDCEVVSSWLDQAVNFLAKHSDAAVVCGRRRERFPERSVYNTLCDIEWDTPTGQTKACGGDAMMRADAFAAVQGYRASLIAGEEPELCVRLRAAHWKIWRIDGEMVLHDANMTRFSQWWKRTLRAGHAYAEGASLHGSSAERHWIKEVRSNWWWGLSFPVILLAASLQPVLLILILLYPLQMWRIYQKSNLHRTPYERKLFAIFCVLAKLPLMLGQLKFNLNAMIGKSSRLIEYK